MKRIKAMSGKRRAMVLVTLVVLVLAAAALIASSASFTSSSSVNNAFTTGNLTLTDAGDVNFAATLWPGHTAEGTDGLVVSAPDGQAGIWVKVVGLPASPSIFDQLTLEILDSTGTSSIVGPVAITDASWADGVQVDTGLADGATPSYTVRVAFTDGDTGATLADKGADNPYMNLPFDFDLEWVAVSE